MSSTFQFTYFFFLLQVFIVPFTPTGRCEGDSGSSDDEPDCILYVCRKNADGDNRCNVDRLINQTGTVCVLPGGENILSDGQTETRAASILFEALENKIKALEIQVKELKSSLDLQQADEEHHRISLPASSSSLVNSSDPSLLENHDVLHPPTAHHHHDMNLTAFVSFCVSLIQQSKKTAAIRYWRSIEDYFLDQNNIQVSFKYLKRIIKASYNSHRVNVLPVLLFINQLERTSQKLQAFHTLLDSLEENGHFPGKEIFTVAFFAGRTFDLENKIWTRFPTPVRLISTLWRLNWFVKHGNESYPLHFANPINSPLEILTTRRNDGENQTSNISNENGINSEELFLDWHFVSTRNSHWLKIIGTSGYVKVDEETMLLIKDGSEREPGEFALHMNENLISFSVFYAGVPIKTRLAFGKPFAFTVQNHGEPPAEFFVEESKTAPNSRIIDLFD